MSSKKYKRPLFKEIAPETYRTFMNQRHLTWLHEICPGARVTRVPYPNAQNMPSYKMGRWDGMVHEIVFENRSHAALYKLRWI